MKLWQIESTLQQLEGFTNPKVKLEQYETPAHIAAHMIFTAETSYGDVQGKTVADLGCGCGMLTVAALMFQDTKVTAFDIDEGALEICRSNLEEVECSEDADLVLADVTEDMTPYHGKFDTVLLNPPFGTKKNQGIDLTFLKVASSLCNSDGVVYSLHKSSTRAHVVRKAQEFGLQGSVVAELRYNLPKTLKFHKKDSVDIQVDFIRFIKPKVSCEKK